MKNYLLAIYVCLNIAFLNAQTLPATYQKTTILNNLRYPADFDWTPDGRYLVTQKGDNSFPAANAMIKIYSSAGILIGTFYDLTDSVDSDFERGLLGIAVDPAFATNHYVYAYYCYRNPAQTKLAMRVVRFTEASNVGTNPTLILNIQYATSPNTYPGNHFGGIIGFRPSQPTMLYIETGDLAYNQTNPTLNYANKLTNPYGKVLRINTNGTIPNTNPFYDDGNPATGNDDRIWSYGHRNMYGMCFNPVTDSMYVSENGLNAWDEFNIIHKGKNYGWATCEGNHMNSSSSVLCNNASFVSPLATWGPGSLPAVTGCLFYSGTAMPEFNNHILVSDNKDGIIYNLTMGNAPAYDVVTSKVNFADIVTSGGLLAMKQGPLDGCIYALKGGYTTAGELYKICHANVGIAQNDQFENSIGQNYPNPSTGKTHVDFSLAQTSNVTIELYDITGRKIKTILSGNKLAGKHTIDVEGLSVLTDGSYFYKIQAEQNNKIVYSETKKMLIIK